MLENSTAQTLCKLNKTLTACWETYLSKHNTAKTCRTAQQKGITLMAAMKYSTFFAMNSWLSTAMTSSLTARLVAQHIGAKDARKKHSRHHSKCLTFCGQTMKHDRSHVVINTCTPAVTAVCPQKQMCYSISCRKFTCRYQMHLQEMSPRHSGSGKKTAAETL